jgi:hypothetical protein
MWYNFLFINCAGVEPSPLLLLQYIGLLHQPCMIDDDGFGAYIEMNK